MGYAFETVEQLPGWKDIPYSLNNKGMGWVLVQMSRAGVDLTTPVERYQMDEKTREITPVGPRPLRDCFQLCDGWVIEPRLCTEIESRRRGQTQPAIGGA